MIINYLSSGGSGAIKPEIPEQNIDYETYVENETSYVYIKGLDLTGLTGEYTIPQYVDGKEVKKIGFNVNTNLGAVFHIIIPFIFWILFFTLFLGVFFCPNNSFMFDFFSFICFFHIFILIK